MSNHLTIEIVGLLNGAAEGPLAIGALVLIIISLIGSVSWRLHHSRILYGTMTILFDRIRSMLRKTK